MPDDLQRAVRAFWDVDERQWGRTPDEIHNLLDLWDFDDGESITIYFDQTARRRWHPAIPGPDRHLIIEDVGLVHNERVSRILDAIRHLATVLGVELDPTP